MTVVVVIALLMLLAAAAVAVASAAKRRDVGPERTETWTNAELPKMSTTEFTEHGLVFRRTFDVPAGGADVVVYSDEGTDVFLDGVPLTMQPVPTPASIETLGLSCDRCGDPIVKPGGVLFGVPRTPEQLGIRAMSLPVMPPLFAPKWHLCEVCTDGIERTIRRR